MVKSELPLKWLKMPAWQVNMITQPTCPECSVRVWSWFCLAFTAVGTGSRQLNKSIQLKVNTRDTTSISPLNLDVRGRVFRLACAPISVNQTLSCAVRTQRFMWLSPQPHHGGVLPSHRFKDCWVLKESCDLPKITQLKRGRAGVKV